MKYKRRTKEDPENLIYDLSKWFFDHNWKRKNVIDDKADMICRTILLMMAADLATLPVVFNFFNTYFPIFLIAISVSLILLIFGMYFSIKALRVRTLAYLIPDPGKIIKEAHGIQGDYSELPRDFRVSIRYKELRKHYIKKLLDYSYSNQRIIEEKANFVKKAQDFVIYNVGYTLFLVVLLLGYLLISVFIYSCNF
ncbi:hypothetical protein [Geoglobus acetivorans]|uniref:hypothetical protein n=1 Tax=Geoglobus acetivorans TaxID=565033 RepID=UPI00064EC7A1